MMTENSINENTNVEFITEIRRRGRPRVIKSEEELAQKPKKPKRCKTPDEFLPNRIRGRPKNPNPKPKVEKQPKPPKEPRERISQTPQYRLDYYREKSSCPLKCPYCGKETIKQKISRHIQKTQSCLMLSMQREFEILRKEKAESQQ